jgi:hypothetical protein
MIFIQKEIAPMKEKRFEEIYSQGTLDIFRVIVDKETGVHYLQTVCGNTGGLTVLLGKDGKPVIGNDFDYNKE